MPQYDATTVTVSASLQPDAADLAGSSNLWLAASYGGALYLYDGAAWQLYAGGALPMAKTGVRLSSGQVVTVLNRFPLATMAGLKGLKLYAGYGTSEQDMLASAGKMAQVFTQGYFRTQGTGLIDGSERAVTLHGINSSGLEFGNGTAYGASGCGNYSCFHLHAQAEYDNAAKWGFNVVRLPISWANLEPNAPTIGAAGLQHDYNASYLNAIDSAVAAAARSGLPVVLSMHHSNWSSAYPQGGGMPAWLNAGLATPLDAERAFLANSNQAQDPYIAVWNLLASRYYGNPTVIGIDLYNEPQRQESASLRSTAVGQLSSFYLNAAAAIQSINPQLLLIAQDFADFYPEFTNFPAISNGVYSFHSYPDPAGSGWTGTRLDGFNAHVAFAAQRGVPLWLGEFGRGGNSNWDSDFRTFVGSLKTQNISWCLWAYQFYSYPLYGLSGTGPLDETQLTIVQTGM